MKTRYWLLALSCCALAGAAVPRHAAAEQPPTLSLEIPAQPLREALSEFGRQSGLQVVFIQTDVDAGLVAGRLAGTYSAKEALERLLANTGLRYEFLNERTVAVRAGTPQAQGASRKAGEGSSLRLAQVEDKGQTGNRSAAGQEGAEGDQDEVDPRGIPEILVRGSRSLNADIVRTRDDAQPYYIFNSDVIEQSGAVNVEDFLKRGLPMNTVARTSSQITSNFRGNQSAINLRGLGTNQTLVLINGRRTASPGLFSGTYQPDLNSIPPSAIERIEVLPASSAAIYGGSAVGGVVNVVLKRGFTGGTVRATYENTQAGNAPIRSVGGTYGLSLEEERTHISISAQYSEADPLLNRDRPELLQRGINRILQNNPSYIFDNNNPFWGATPNISAALPGTSLSLLDGTPLNSPITSIPAGFTATSDPMALVANAGSFNTSLPNSAQTLTGLRRPIGAGPTVKTVMGSFQRKMNDRLSVFADFYRSSNAALTANFTPLDSVLQVPAGAPTNPFREAVNITIMDPYTSPYRARSDDRRFTAGFTVKLPRDWMVASDYTWSESRLRYEGPIYSLGGISADLASGALNPFVDTLAQSLDLSKYRGSFGASQTGTLSDFSVRTAGPLFSLPAGHATLTVGLERRKEGLQDGRFFNQKPNYPDDTQYRKYLGQSQTINSAYAEANIPLIGEGNQRPGVRLLDAQISARTERFSIGSGTAFQYVAGSAPAFIDNNLSLVHFTSKLESTNPTFGLRFKPVDSFTLRASYGTAFLPPTYAQLVPGNVALVLSAGVPRTTEVIDPLRGNTLTTVQFATGGNPDLKPQESKNLNIGAIFEPAAIPSLRMNLEWYRLKQTNVILQPSSDTILSNESQFASRITRAAVQPGDPYGVGVLTFVDFSLLNANRGETDGIDFSLSYQHESDRHGIFGFSLSGTKILSYKTQTGFNQPLVDIVNQVANDGPLQYKANAILTWDFRNWGLGWMTNYYGSYPQYNAGGATAYVAAQGGNRIASQDYHNLFASYRFPGGSAAGGWGSRALADVTIQGGIRNVFNTVPPFDAFYSTSYFYSPFGDARLRSFYLTLEKKF